MGFLPDLLISAASRPSPARPGTGAGSWIFRAVISLAVASLAACSSNPTPYQPLGEEGGYEESRLQQRLYRVSFKGNRQTREADVLDFLFLRC